MRSRTGLKASVDCLIGMAARGYHVTGVDIHAERHVLCGFDREAAVGMRDTFWPPCGAGRVNEDERVFGGGWLVLGQN